MGDDVQVREAAERVRRVKAGERTRTVYGFDDEKMDDFMYRMLENAKVRDLQLLADTYLALTDPGGDVARLRAALAEFASRDCNCDVTTPKGYRCVRCKAVAALGGPPAGAE
jgi:hypothetical protein